MLIEQSFLMLPEILHGTGYQTQDYEAGIVGAFSLALLQSLNGRNALSPIGWIQHERLYRKGGVFAHAAHPRYLRADLFLTVERLYVANKRLSQYGWRHEVWLEAKFFRNQSGPSGIISSPNSTAHVASLMADLIRLITLVDEPASESRSGRYFLHVYDAEPKMYLTFNKRAWLTKLTAPGRHSIKISDLDKEANTVKKILGTLTGLSIEATVTNMVIAPLDETHRPIYHCILTRIDSFRVTVDTYWKEVDVTRTVTSNDGGRIAAFVAEHLNIAAGSDESVPPPDVDADVDEPAAVDAAI